jgi:hypothetical protein
MSEGTIRAPYASNSAIAYAQYGLHRLDMGTLEPHYKSRIRCRHACMILLHTAHIIACLDALPHCKYLFISPNNLGKALHSNRKYLGIGHFNAQPHAAALPLR